MSNINRIRQAMPEYKCDAMIITDQVNRLFATGFSSSAGALLIAGESAWFFIDSRYTEAAKASIKDAQVVLITNEKDLIEKVKKVLEDNSIKSIGFEDKSLSYASYQKWSEILDIEMIPAQKLLIGLRAVKSRTDLENMIKSQRLSEKVFEEVLPMICTDMTEKDLAAEMIYRFLKYNADDKAFNPIVVSGSNSSRPHGVPGTEKISNGFLTIDFGVKLDGWCSDTTRTLCVGEPDDEMVKVYDTVLKAQESGIKAMHAGVKGIDVDTAARTVIEDAGYGDFFGHGFGHSIGLEVHESPGASQLSEDILPAGTVITAEPGIYIPGRFGVRIEDVIYITETGIENITKLPKELIVL